VLGEKMHQLLLLVYLLSGQHIEWGVRNTIRNSKPGTETLAVIQVRDHEHDVPADISTHSSTFHRVTPFGEEMVAERVLVLPSTIDVRR
jgi:hypothetical protein